LLIFLKLETCCKKDHFYNMIPTFAMTH
jgi:hypothetical protein